MFASKTLTEPPSKTTEEASILDIRGMFPHDATVTMVYLDFNRMYLVEERASVVLVHLQQASQTKLS